MKYRLREPATKKTRNNVRSLFVKSPRQLARFRAFRDVRGYSCTYFQDAYPSGTKSLVTSDVLVEWHLWLEYYGESTCDSHCLLRDSGTRYELRQLAEFTGSQQWRQNALPVMERSK